MTTPAGDILADAAALHAARRRLLGVGYRVTGSWSDAEEATDEALARLAVLRTEADRPENPEAWLTTVATRLSLDRLRRRKRESYVGDWLPEPVDTALLPDESAERTEGLRMALLVAYEQLAPLERAAFVLREAYAMPYEEIAAILEHPPATVRQWVSRARRRLRADGPLLKATGQATVEPLLGAILSGDLAAVVSALTDDVQLVSDGGGKVNAARRTISGPRKVAYFLVKAAEAGNADDLALTQVNNEPALLTRMGGVIRVFQLFAAEDGQIATLLVHCNPDKLASVSLPFGWRETPPR